MAKTYNNPHARFHGLLANIPFTTKEELVWECSGMLTTSLSEFFKKNPRGYKAMLEHMQQIVDSMPINNKPEKANQAEIKKLRSAILHRLQKHGIDTTSWERVNNFMKNPRIAGKLLYEMTEEEMRHFIPKMESILAKDKSYKHEIQRLAERN